MSANLGAVTKQDFEALAGLYCRHGASEDLIGGTAEYFQRQNPRFDAVRFTRATRKC